MSAPLPSPFLSPVFSPFSPSPELNHHDKHCEHHDPPSPSPHRKRERVKSFVKHLASPFASPTPSHAHLPPDTGSPSHPIISLSPELDPAPAILRKRTSGSSVKSLMKNVPSPQSSPSPSSTPFPGTPDSSRLGLNPNTSSPEIDHHGSPTRKRERVRSFVKSIRRTSSQLFKKDKKDSESRKSSSTISTLVSDSLSVSTAATAPGILRRFSHSKHPSMGSMNTTDSDLSASYLEVKVGDGGSINSPIIEVATPISPAVVEPVEPTPMSPLKETSNEEDSAPETQPEVVQTPPPSSDLGIPEVDPQSKGEYASEGADPLQFPLPPSPIPSPSPIAVPVDPIPVNQREDDAIPHNNESSHNNTASHEDDVPLNGDSSSNTQEVSSSGQVQPLDTTDVTSIIPPPQTSEPSSLPEPSNSTSDPDNDEADREMRELCIPVLIPPMLFWPISNMRLSYFFTPVLTWWLSKGVLSYPYLYS